MINQIKVVFFDAVGTLFTVRSSVGEIYAQVAIDYGIKADVKVLNQAFIKAFKTATPNSLSQVNLQDLQNLSDHEKAWWRDVVAKTFKLAGYEDWILLPDFNAYFQQVFDLFSTAAPWQLYDETLITLQSLQSSGIQLGIISNFDSRLYAVLQALELQSFFSSVTISTVVGVAKPNAQVFQIALEQQQIGAAVALHVGDSYSEDYWGAKQAGLQALWLDRAELALIPTFANEIHQIPETDRIADLRQLLQLL